MVDDAVPGTISGTAETSPGGAILPADTHHYENCRAEAVEWSGTCVTSGRNHPDSNAEEASFEAG